MKSLGLKSLVFSALCLLATASFAQQLENFGYGKEKFYDFDRWGIGLMYSMMSNPGLPYPKEHRFAAFSLRLDYKDYYLDRGRRRFYWQNKSIGDMVALLGGVLKKKQTVFRDNDETVLSHIFGPASWGWNVNHPGRSSLALGFNINDFVVASEVYDRDNNGNLINGRTPEPHGWYLGIGPSVFFDYAISESLVLQTVTNYSLNAFRFTGISNAIADKTYPRPHAVQMSAEVLSKLKLNAGIEFTFIIDRGPTGSKARRLDLIASYRF